MTVTTAQPWQAGRHAAPTAPTSRVAPLAALAGALLGAVVFAVTRASLVDDAYITLTYAKTLGLHGEWGMVEGLTSNTATSPLNVLLLGAATAVVRDAVLAVGVLLVALFAAAGWWLTIIGRELDAPPWRAPAFGLAFLATSPLLLSTVGLESYLAAVLLLGAVAAVLQRRAWAAGAVAGALVLTRPDLFVFGALVVLVTGREWWKAAGAAVAVTVPWFAWSWWNLGSAVPDSMLLKAGQSWGYWTYWTGPGLWWPLFPTAVTLTAVAAAAGLVCLPMWARRGRWQVGVVLGVGAVTHAALFVAMTTAPFHWYYAPAVSGLGLLAALTAARARHLTGAVATVAVGGLAAVCAVSVLAGSRDRAPIASNWASAAQYETIARQLPRGATVQSPGEVGTLAYYCDCRVLDGFADPALLEPLLEQRLADAGPLTRRLLEWNYARFDPGVPQQMDYTMPVWALPPAGAPMVGSWGDGRGWAVVPAP